MNWTELLKSEAETAYKATDGLFDLVDADAINWKPAGDNNWMTTGQLMKHITTACGFCFQMFVEPEAMPDMPEGEGMMSADQMPTVEDVAEAKAALAKDKELAWAMLAKAGEDGLANKETPAPWDPTPMPLGRRLLSMVEHLNMHKAQLFMYLKMQGKPVNTWNLYGMEPPPG